MIFNVNIKLELDDSANVIPADGDLGFMLDLLKDLFYDADDVTILELDLEKEQD